jgi:ferritin-like metal-binding protein YciE
MKIRTMQDLLVDLLRDLYGAEKDIFKALGKMARVASNPELAAAFREHRSQTEQHLARLEQAFELLGVGARKKKCPAVEGIIEEGEDLIDADLDADLLDAGLIAVAQKVEHYEIAGYGTARIWAEQLLLAGVVELLEQTLEEEKETDRKLTRLAEARVNKEAEVGSSPG